jgi:hypothetical protein
LGHVEGFGGEISGAPSLHSSSPEPSSSETPALTRVTWGATVRLCHRLGSSTRKGSRFPQHGSVQRGGGRREGGPPRTASGYCARAPQSVLEPPGLRLSHRVAQLRRFSPAPQPPPGRPGFPTETASRWAVPRDRWWQGRDGATPHPDPALVPTALPSRAQEVSGQADRRTDGQTVSLPGWGRGPPAPWTSSSRDK